MKIKKDKNSKDTNEKRKQLKNNSQLSLIEKWNDDSKYGVTIIKSSKE